MGCLPIFTHAVGTYVTSPACRPGFRSNLEDQKYSTVYRTFFLFSKLPRLSLNKTTESEFINTPWYRSQTGTIYSVSLHHSVVTYMNTNSDGIDIVQKSLDYSNPR